MFGVCGLAFVQWFYFLAIHRLAIGIALLVQYLAPLLVALWARYVFHEPVRRRVWLALALALGGLALIVDVRRGGTVSTAGILFAVAAAATYMLYILLAEHAVGVRGAVPLLAWGFGFAALFFAVIAPWWSFPGHEVSANVSLLGHLSTRHLPVWALMTSMVRARDDRAVLPDRQRAPAPAGDARRDHRDARARDRDRRRVGSGSASRSASIQLTGAIVVLAAIVLAQTAR